MKVLLVCPRGSRSGRKTSSCSFVTGLCARQTSRTRCPRLSSPHCSSTLSSWSTTCTFVSWSVRPVCMNLGSSFVCFAMKLTRGARLGRLLKCSFWRRLWPSCSRRSADILCRDARCCLSRQWPNKQNRLLPNLWRNGCPIRIPTTNSANLPPCSTRHCSAWRIPSPNSNGSQPTPRTNFARRSRRSARWARLHCAKGTIPLRYAKPSARGSRRL